MRTALVEKPELIARLKNEFGVGEPIFVSEILEAWSEYSRPRVFRLIKEFCESGEIIKYTMGVYYFPKKTFWGGVSTLDPTKIAEKRYLKSDGRVFGYYSGLTLLNMAGFSNQVPNIREIVTMGETTKVREVSIGKARFILRSAKTEITNENAPIFQLLEIFNKVDNPLEKYQKDNLLMLTGGKINEKTLYECAKYFPKRALQNFNKSEMKHVAL